MPEPSRSFMKDLKLMDKRLDCHFEPDHGHFVVTYERPYRGSVIVHLVKAEDGGFRQPNKLDLEFIKGGDMATMSIRERMNRVSHHMEQVQEKNRRNSADMFKHATQENRRQLAPAFDRLFGAGKGNATFRRITPKPKGIVYPPRGPMPPKSSVMPPQNAG
jgi:hypothetical protein